MSDDLRNSLLLWLGAILTFALFLALPHLSFLDGISKTWVGHALQVLGLLGFGRAVWQIWSRRASNRNPPKA